VLAGGQYFSALRESPRAQAFLGGAGPAAIGAILGAAVPLARALGPWWQYAGLALAFVALFVLRRGPVSTLLGLAALGALLAGMHAVTV
jgi:chromate transporter